jgi:LPXTG-motif cell wall-anchored protein
MSGTDWVLAILGAENLILAAIVVYFWRKKCRGSSKK